MGAILPPGDLVLISVRGERMEVDPVAADALELGAAEAAPDLVSELRAAGRDGRSLLVALNEMFNPGTPPPEYDNDIGRWMERVLVDPDGASAELKAKLTAIVDEIKKPAPAPDGVGLGQPPIDAERWKALLTDPRLEAGLRGLAESLGELAEKLKAARPPPDGQGAP